MAPRSDDLQLSVQPPRRRPHRQVPLRRRPGRRRTGVRYGRPSGRRVTILGTPTRRWQRSTVKTSYARNGRGAPWRAHGTYLAREGAQREGTKGLGFNAEREDLDLAGTLRGWQAAGDERLWKLIVSPEHAASLDLREHARALVAQMERDLGSRLEWVAIDHYNTDNPHVHLLVRGRDQDGRGLRMPRDYVASGLRHRSQALATQRLGWRSDREILAARAHGIERTQFIELDRALLRRADARGMVSYREPVPPPGPRREAYTHELRRLQFLEKTRLAEKIGSRTWQLRPEMETALRQAQLMGDIITSRARHLAHLSDPRMPLVLTRIEAGSRVTGRLVGQGWADELQEQRYLLLEATDGRLHYVPLPAAAERAPGAPELGVGDIVTVTGQTIERQGRRQVQIAMRREPRNFETPAQAVEHRGRGPERPAPPRPSAKDSKRPIRIVQPLDGLIARGHLVGFAQDRAGHRYAVLDTGGRALEAFRTDEAGLIVGQQVRANGEQVHDGQRRLHVWRLIDDERERQRGRER